MLNYKTTRFCYKANNNMLKLMSLHRYSSIQLICNNFIVEIVGLRHPIHPVRRRPTALTL